ncbi:hypothetical protein ANTQUA_LOCUS3482 [Anthophora quadrimaculata]
MCGIRLFYLSRTVVVATCSSDACFRIEAFEIQNSTTVAYSTWDYRRNATILEFSVVIVLRVELRLVYLSRTVVVARCASDTCFRIDAFENQNSSTVAYSTWDYRRNAAIQEFSAVIVLRIELRLFYLSRTVVVARCASDTCFRIEAFENQNSTTVAYLKCAVCGIRLFYLSRTVVVATCASDACFRIEAFEIQNSTTVAYSTWDYRRNATILEFSVVIVLRVELRLVYLSRTVVVARCASDTCFRIEAFDIQNSTTVAYSTWDYRRIAAGPVFSVVIVLGTELRLFYLS